jgi:hypothetical protein
MTFFKASRVPVMAACFCLMLVGFAGASYGSVRFDVVGSPTEVINTGRSEVVGSVNLIVRGAGNLTGTSTGGCNQIGIIYTNPAMQIDNTITTGIRIFFSSGFASAFTVGAGTPCATVGVVDVRNQDINGRCSGFITINMAPGAVPLEGDFIRLDGVRGRVDASLAITPGTDLFADLQSINDPAAALFTPDRVRVAKSLDGMNVEIRADSILLCFPTLGVVGGGAPGYQIRITEGFARAFVDSDANNDGALLNDRVDSGSDLGIYTMNAGNTAPVANPGSQSLGLPSNSTQFLVWLEGIPTSVSGIVWPTALGALPASATPNAQLVFQSSGFTASAGIAFAYYSYEAINQTGVSDITVETFAFAANVPASSSMAALYYTPVTAVLKSNQTVSGTVLAAVSLGPDVGEASGCSQPGTSLPANARPRFLQMYESDAIATNNPPSDPHRTLVTAVRCNCYLLFTYVTATSTFNTGIVVANTTGDIEVFGTNDAPDQLGNISFYFYDRTAGYVGSTTTTTTINMGRSYVDLISGILPTGVTSFSGYVIAKAEFQFCHGFAFIADSAFGSIAHGYLANVIPDPAIKGEFVTVGSAPVRKRTAADAGDTNSPLTPAGEGLNN